MHVVSDVDLNAILALIQATRENLDRIEDKLRPGGTEAENDLDPGNPLNKMGRNLSPRGVEVCYRMFDQGKSRYAVAQALSISYGAANYRCYAWEKLGGRNRKCQPIN